MSAKSHQTDYFGINSTKIYSANPSGNFTVTSLPLTRRHLQDLESPSNYNLLFDLIANKFSRSPLHRRSTQQIHTPIQASTEASRRPRPVLSATKSAEAILTPQRRQHQQGRGCRKLASKDTRSPDSSPSTENQVHIAVHSKQRPRITTVTPADTHISSPIRTRPLNSPYESPSRIGAKSVGALLTLPEQTNHNQQLNVQHQQSPTRVRPAEVVLPRHNTILCGFHRLRSSATASAYPILPSRVHSQRSQAFEHFRPPKRVSSRNLSSTISLPAPAMAPEHPHHLDPDSPDPFTAFGNPHQKTTLLPHKESMFSFRNVKKALRIGAADRKGEQKRQDRADKCSKKIGRENAEAATRAEREQKEGAEKMRKLEKEAENKRLRREEQAVNMEKKRRREEEKERIMEVRRHERALGGMSWGFDPSAGTRASRESGSGDHACHCSEGSDEAGGVEGSDSQRIRRGTTWGVTGGGPGKVGGCHGSDASRS